MPKTQKAEAQRTPAERWRLARAQIKTSRRLSAASALKLVQAVLELTGTEDDISDDVANRLSFECGISIEELDAVRLIKKATGEDRERLISSGLSLSVISAILVASDATREETFRRIEDDEHLTGSIIGQIDKEEKEAATSSAELLLKQWQKIMRQKIKEHGQRAIDELQRSARQLLAMYGEYKEIFGSHVDDDDTTKPQDVPESVLLGHEAAMREQAKRLHPTFVKLFGDDHADEVQWAFIAIHDPDTASIARVAFVLRKMCQGEFGVGQTYGGVHCGVDFMFSSLAYLAGTFVAAGQRDRRRPLKKLKSIILNAGIGGEAIGLRGANFYPAALFEDVDEYRSVIKKSMAHWPVSDARLGTNNIRTEIAKLRKDLAVVCGGLLSAYNVQRNKDTIDLIRLADPKAFFFGLPPRISRNMRNTINENLIGLVESGYEIEPFRLSLSDFGLAQNGKCEVIVGLKPEYAKNFILPQMRPVEVDGSLLPQDYLDPISGETRASMLERYARLDSNLSDYMEALIKSDVKIGHYRITRGDRKFENRAREEAREEARARWCATYGTNKVPMLTPWTKNPGDKRKKDWKAAGFKFSAMSQSVETTIATGDFEGCIGLSVHAYKALQGFPLTWKTEGMRRATASKAIALCLPPPISTAIGFCLYAAITGKKIRIADGLRAPPIPAEAIGIVALAKGPGLNLAAVMPKRHPDPEIALAEEIRDLVIMPDPFPDQLGENDPAPKRPKTEAPRFPPPPKFKRFEIGYREPPAVGVHRCRAY
ncbi:DNA cytosine methyltransferase [Rhizobium sp. NXC24]|uniref:DNA cytosine methyltransferase n=1 Tax=Rhizobium sp. NXC24 TaxID=2048897 RepID=UPI000CDF401D|nr:DNA cytosine methyltransferase [Rhizobium sp. NXC24]AVA21286.1 methyltransferase domain-containing protein [Rhizobium sp. NXC24]